MTGSPARGRWKRWGGVLVTAAALVAVWTLAPIDLVPTWAAVGSGAALAGPFGGPLPSDEFTRSLVGLRTAQAQERDAAAGFRAVATGLCLTGCGRDASFQADRIHLTVIGGRVVLAEAEG